MIALSLLAVLALQDAEPLKVQVGVTVDRVEIDGKFRGYLAANKSGWQNHFFGSPFRGDASDMTFFNRVDFGPLGKLKCDRYNGERG